MKFPLISAFIDGHRRARMADTGFTMIEVALALGVAAVALVSVFVLMQTGFKTYGEAISANIATGITQEVVSQFLLSDFDTLARQPAGAEITNFYDERGVILDAADQSKAIYRSVAKVLEPTVHGIDRSKLLPCQVTVTSPTHLSLKRVYTFFIVRQAEDAP